MLTLISSDSLEPHPYWFFNGDVSILRDSMFYRILVNIINLWEVGAMLKIVGKGQIQIFQQNWRLSTPLKDHYIAMFPDLIKILNWRLGRKIDEMVYFQTYVLWPSTLVLYAFMYFMFGIINRL